MDENRIIELCKKNDMNAFKMIYQEYEQPLLRTSIRLLRDRQDAEDAVQQTFLKLYRSIGNFSFQSKFSTYLFRILINTSYDILRKKKRTGTMAILDVHPVESSGPELKYSLERAIGKLPDRMRACFVLFAVEGFRQKEIAGIMSISLEGVKSNIYQARCRLRKQLVQPETEAV